MRNKIEVIRTDVNGFSRIDKKEKALLIVEIERNDIDICNLASTLEKLMALTDTRESVMQFQNSVMFQVTGYDADQRELPEIPEVRKFFVALAAEWPHFVWFLARETGAIPLMFSLLCQVLVVRSKKGQFGASFKDTEEVKRVFADLISRQQSLCTTFDIAEQVEDSIESALNELF